MEREDLQPRPGMPSLRELLEAVRSPGVLKSDVDALLRGLALPLAQGESPRARADLLLSMIESPEVGDFKGSQGRSVRTAAAQALVDLGYPYALEIPPEALAEARDEVPPVGRGPSSAGIALSVLTLVVQLVPFGFIALLIADKSLLLGMLALAMVVAPIPLAILGGILRKRFPQKLGVTLMALMALCLGAYAVPQLFDNTWLETAFDVCLATAAVAHVLGAFLLRPPGWLSPGDGEEVPDSGTPRDGAP